jgi:hypothetical protein
MTKSISDLGCEAFDEWWDSGNEMREVFDNHLERFATLHRASILEELTGAEMPEPVAYAYNGTHGARFDETQLREAIASAVVREREQCAQLCAAYGEDDLNDVAAAIRARGNV